MVVVGREGVVWLRLLSAPAAARVSEGPEVLRDWGRRGGGGGLGASKGC